MGSLSAVLRSLFNVSCAVLADVSAYVYTDANGTAGLGLTASRAMPAWNEI